MKVTFNVPQSIYDVPLGQYQQYDKVIEANKDAEDHTFIHQKMVSIFCDVPMSDLRKLPMNQVEVVIEALAKTLNQDAKKHHRIIKISGVEFGFIPNFDELTFGEFVDIDAYSKKPEDWHRLMAVLYRPITKKLGDSYDIEPYESAEKYGDLMKWSSLGDATGALAFFLTLCRTLLADTQAYLKEMRMSTATEKPLDKNGDGIKPSTILQVETLLASAVSQLKSWTDVSLN